jgi:ATP-dependent RNA helicase DeaD
MPHTKAEKKTTEETAAEATPESGFAKLGLEPKILAALEYSDPSPIQREAIPVVLTGKDIVGLAGTGTGKTAAFALPIIHLLHADPGRKKGVAALVLVPTRELAIQVARATKKYGKPVGIDVVAIYGGTGYSEQITAIRRGVDIVVATPGRALDLVNRGKFPLDAITKVVLDEADEMLDMGFADDIEAMLSHTPKERQTMLFSATMPPRIEEIAKKHLNQPTRIRVARETPAEGKKAKVRQTAYLVRREQKLQALGRVLDIERPTSTIIFCRTRGEADDLTETMNHGGFKPLALHGGLTQEQRDRVMKRFRDGSANLLIATDIAARGLDISQLSHVVNFDVPANPDAYVHRIGRVGRAGREGVAITFVTPQQQGALRQIERVANLRVTFAPVPSGKDLKAARIERLKSIVQESLGSGEASGELRGLLGELEQDHKLKDIALAALKLLAEPEKATDNDEIGVPAGAPPRPERMNDRPPRSSQDLLGRRPSRGTRPGMTKVFFGIGREFGVAPRDLVGAIANEAGVPGKDLGLIDMTDRFALVEVPSDAAEYVVEAMQGTRIRGRKVVVRLDRPPPRG